MDKLFKYLFLLMLAMMVLSCHNRPSEVLPRKKMENVMYDMYIAEAIIDHDYQNFTLPEKKEALINHVLEKHKISEARWDTSLSWYSDNIDQYLQINDSVKSRLQREQNVVQKLSMQNAAMLEEFNIKPRDYIPRNYHIAGLGCDRGFKFMLDSTQLAERFEDNDTIHFRFKVLGVVPYVASSLKSMLTVKYADTTIYHMSQIEENKSYSFPLLRNIEQDTIVSLNGFVNLSGKLPLIPLQLYQISLGSIDINDSTVLIKDPSKELFEKPMLLTE
ncbi:MAG: DUF4296 domain-containing protein [Bacteroidales bacterium]|jgi:hypothetical protein|nr:DUF4296 domain-containing protein [Bacteroidales bacterium]